MTFALCARQVEFACEDNFILTGSAYRVCEPPQVAQSENPQGQWSGDSEVNDCVGQQKNPPEDDNDNDNDNIGNIHYSRLVVVQGACLKLLYADPIKASPFCEYKQFWKEPVL